MTTVYMGLWAAGIFTGCMAGLVLVLERRVLTWSLFTGGLLAIAGFVVGAKLQYRIEVFPMSYALRVSTSEILEPGMRIPLGVLLGGLIGCLWCFAWRGPWRDLGDALALSASIMVPIGRIGCFLNGCCMGTVCGPWALPVCMRFPPGSEAYNQQLRDSLITLSDTQSLPAHPLPLYFGATSLLIAFVLIAMARRKAAPGMMLLVGAILSSAGKLALETLRAEPRPPGAMFLIPATVLVVGLVVLAGVLVRRALAGREPATLGGAAKGAVVGALVLGLGTLALPAPARAQAENAPHVPAGAEALAAYARNPLHNRRGLRLLEHQGTADLPPVVLIAMADARLRSGQRKQAAHLFQELIDRQPGEPWASWAKLGLGWNALLGGDPDGARPWLQEVAGAGTPTSGLANLMVALIDASDGKAVGVRVFDEVARDPQSSPVLRDVARLGGAYARYWNGDFQAAATAFEQAESISTPNLVDDAKYGAAWSRIKAGDRAVGEPALRALAGSARTHGPAVSEALVNLDQRALLRSGFERYRRGPVRAPEDQMSELLDGDGARMAREALHYLDDVPETTRADLRRPIYGSDQDVRIERASEVVPIAAPKAATAATAPAKHPASSGGGGSAWWLLAAILLGAGYVAATWRRPAPPRAGRKW
ncbi:MAG TPA: prolipoprotein diacylglyceryl transferase family protein [Verrucomicrobiae bacterium]|nr:prolipoprotein diacylglyceryl transferase family protein [Verrucomicrobiae bacterium]